MKDETVVLIGAVAIGGILLYSMFKPFKDLVDTGGKALGGVLQAPQQTSDLLGSIFTPVDKFTPEQVIKTSKELGTTMPKVTPTNILENPVGSFFDMFKALPSIITGVRIGLSGSKEPGTALKPTPKITTPQTASKLAPLVIVPAPGAKKIQLTDLRTGKTSTASLIGGAQIPSRALSQKLRGLM